MKASCGLSFLGIFFGVFGVVLVLAGRNAAAEGVRAERLTPISAVVFDDSPLDREVLIEGTISDRNQERFRSFVAYVREEYRGDDDDGDPEWVEDERVTPPLLLDLANGRVQVENDTYAVRNPPIVWQEDTSLRWDSWNSDGTKRYSGFEVNDPVLAIGTVVEGREGRALEAEFLFGGTRAQYIAQQQRDARILPLIGGGIALVGVVLLLIAGLVFIRWVITRR